MPKRRALGTWWQVSAATSTGIAQAHRHDREPARVIEHRFLDPQPLPQPFSACIVPRNPTFVNLKAWCLTDHQDASGRRDSHNRSRTQREMRLADAASLNLTQKRVKAPSSSAVQRHRRQVRVVRKDTLSRHDGLIAKGFLSQRSAAQCRWWPAYTPSRRRAQPFGVSFWIVVLQRMNWVRA